MCGAPPDLIVKQLSSVVSLARLVYPSVALLAKLVLSILTYRNIPNNQNISPFCNFCSYNDGSTDLHLEVVSHLFYDCRLVQKLWQEIGTWLMGFDLQISVDKKVLLFGKIDQSSSSIENVLILTTSIIFGLQGVKMQNLILLPTKDSLNRSLKI